MINLGNLMPAEFLFDIHIAFKVQRNRSHNINNTKLMYMSTSILYLYYWNSWFNKISMFNHDISLNIRANVSQNIWRLVHDLSKSPRWALWYRLRVSLPRQEGVALKPPFFALSNPHCLCPRSSNWHKDLLDMEDEFPLWLWPIFLLCDL